MFLCIGCHPIFAFFFKVYMVSEGVQTNGFSRRSSSDTQTSPPNRHVRPPVQQPPLPPYQDPPPPPKAAQQSVGLPQSPPKKKPQLQPKPTSVAAASCSPHDIKTKPFLPPHIAASQLPGYQLQIYHLDGDGSPKGQHTSPSSWYGTAPRSGKHQHHHSHHKHSHHNHHGKATRSQSSGNVLDEHFEERPHHSQGHSRPKPSRVSPSNNSKQAEKCSKHLQKSLSEGKLTEDQAGSESSVQTKPPKAVKFSNQPSEAEDEVSDKDLPELAPITTQEYQSVMVKSATQQQEVSSHTVRFYPFLSISILNFAILNFARILNGV